MRWIRNGRYLIFVSFIGRFDSGYAPCSVTIIHSSLNIQCSADMPQILEMLPMFICSRPGASIVYLNAHKNG
jgi:hypothetical protein